MSLNDGPINKNFLRDEIALATEKFIADGGVIERGRGRRVLVVCRLCRHHRYISLNYVAHFKPACTKCGAEAKIQL
jgi:hypothetical protein